MSKRKEFIEPVEISQVENGFLLYAGAMCSNLRERYVFQTLAELQEFLSDHFTHRNDDIEIDSYSSSNN